MYEQSLRNLGLSESEVKVYVALLELGTSKVDIISKRSNFPRTTVYGLINSLLNRGIVSYVIKSGVKHYEAVSPKRLLVIENEKLESLKKSIPELEAIRNTVGEKPIVQMYEGKEGIKSIYEDMLKTQKTIHGYGSTKLLFELLEYYVPNYIKRRSKLGISFKVITENSIDAKEMKKKDKVEKRETRFIDEISEMNTVTYIYGDKISIMGLIKKQPVGIIIKNEQISKSNMISFNLLWKIAKP